MAADEKNVAGEDDAILRHIDDDVAAGMRRADFDDAHLFAADAERDLAVEGARRQRQANPLVVEARPHHLVKKGGPGAERAPIAHHRRQLFRRPLPHLLGAGA